MNKNKEVQNIILSMLIDEPLSPSELLYKVHNEKGIKDSVIRIALWELIDRYQVELSTDRKLNVRWSLHHIPPDKDLPSENARIEQKVRRIEK